MIEKKRTIYNLSEKNEKLTKKRDGRKVSDTQSIILIFDTVKMAVY